MKPFSSTAFGLPVVVCLAALWAAHAIGAHPVLADPTEDDAATGRVDPDFAAGKKAIEAKNWPAAIAALSQAALRDTRNADIENYLGYAYRNTGQMESAFLHYEKALALNPRHRGAHEYIGETYLLVGKLAEARRHLAALQSICLLPCQEYEDLKARIDEYVRKDANPAKRAY